jgi:N-methylhydantoinase A
VSAVSAVAGVDTGGTFTDIVVIDEAGRLLVRKADNSAADPTASIAGAIDDVLREAAIPGAGVSRVVHCTTILGNAVIQRSGPVCGLVTTEGFRDVLELRRQRNPVLYDVFWKKTPPLVPRRLCREVRERIGADGSVVAPLDMASVDRALDLLAEEGIESIAVCLINACTNPAHERAVADRIRERFPGLPISLSSEVSPEWGEYERTSTTVADAFVKPIFRSYLHAFDRRLDERGIRPELHIMQSAGSVVPAAAAVDAPAACLDSGPAATVIAAAQIGAALGYRDLVTLEIGGTTAKSTIVEGGEPRRVTESEIGTPIGSDGRSLRGGGYVLRVPVIDLAEVGAGGGSIAQVDAGGSLAVGPQGAGADPGPASYGRGGDRPTVTDANLVLGYLSETHPLGGTIRLRRELAEAALKARVADPLGISMTEAAHTVRSLANAIMARAIRSVSTERGRDVRRYKLLAAGGGGPGHAAEIARLLGIGSIVVPPHAGVFSSLGLLWSVPERRIARALSLRLDRADAGTALAAAFEALAAELGSFAAKGRAELRRLVDVHYVGQFHDLTVPVATRGGAIDMAAVRRAFEREHQRTYGYVSAEEGCEIRAARLVVRYPKAAARPEGALALPEAAGGEVPSGGTRDVYFGPRLGWQRASVLSRGALGDAPVQGPIIIPEYDTTVTVPPDFTVRREASGALVLDRVARAEER